MAISSGQWAISYILVVDTTFRKCPSREGTSGFLFSSWQEFRHDGWSWSNHLEFCHDVTLTHVWKLYVEKC